MKQRQILVILAAIVVVAAGAIYFFTSGSGQPVLPETASEAPAAKATPAASTAAPSEAPVATIAAAQSAGSALMTPVPLGDMTLGDPKAPVTVIEYASMTCSHCQRFHATVYRPFKEKYIDTGKVYFIFREFPLDPLALAASALARCAPKERYFPIVDLLFDTQSSWAFVDDPKTALFNVVKQAGFTQDSFNACLTDTKISNAIDQGRTAAVNLGVEATPTFFFNGKKQAGELSLEEIDKLVSSS
jgi:protein-disulfide isomerase